MAIIWRISKRRTLWGGIGHVHFLALKRVWKNKHVVALWHITAPCRFLIANLPATWLLKEMTDFITKKLITRKVYGFQKFFLQNIICIYDIYNGRFFHSCRYSIGKDTVWKWHKHQKTLFVNNIDLLSNEHWVRMWKCFLW